jgi:hypothetical protein
MPVRPGLWVVLVVTVYALPPRSLLGYVEKYGVPDPTNVLGAPLDDDGVFLKFSGRVLHEPFRALNRRGVKFTDAEAKRACSERTVCSGFLSTPSSTQFFWRYALSRRATEEGAEGVVSFVKKDRTDGFYLFASGAYGGERLNGTFDGVLLDVSGRMVEEDVFDPSTKQLLQRKFKSLGELDAKAFCDLQLSCHGIVWDVRARTIAFVRRWLPTGRNESSNFISLFRPAYANVSQVYTVSQPLVGDSGGFSFPSRITPGLTDPEAIRRCNLAPPCRGFLQLQSGTAFVREFGCGNAPTVAGRTLVKPLTIESFASWKGCATNATTLS